MSGPAGAGGTGSGDRQLDLLAGLGAEPVEPGEVTRRTAVPVRPARSAPGSTRPAPAGPGTPAGRGGPGRPHGQAELWAAATGPGLSAVDVARALGRPLPTPEQIAVIEAPVQPLLVVAGAGSGKTETMAARVVWLVANGLVRAEEVLGLTFTRKAAGELADRIRSRLRALHRRGLTEVEPQPVTVSTYHAYAAAVLRDHGLRLGVEPGARLLGEAGAWQLAAELVEQWDGEMSAVELASTSVTEAVLALAGECSEHLVDPDRVGSFLEQLLERAAELPAEPGDPAPGAPRAPVRDRLARLAARGQVLPLVQAYRRRKQELGVLDFGDQLALAAAVAQREPAVGAGERERYRVVLLDEYQDTSHAQLVLLRSLFGGGHPVAAVGDPHQSIYGWRGASAGNLERFRTDFPLADGSPAGIGFLSTSWRNDRAVLTVANRVAGPLRRSRSWQLRPADGDPVPPLSARPGAGTGEVLVGWYPTVEDEAAALAELIAAQWDGGEQRAAVLCRTRSQFPLVEAALRARDLPVEVVGLGGLLSAPEIADLRCALEVVHDPSRGDSLARLLTGPACRLSPRDLAALAAWSVESHRGLGPERSAQAASPAPRVPEAAEQPCLADALDALPPPDWRPARSGPGADGLSAEARRRLERLAATLRALRARTGAPLPDLVLEVERALLLDVEVAVRSGARQGLARATLDAFVEVAAAFADSGERAGLGAFLDWLAAADERERGLEAPLSEVRPDAVQVLTVHAAKGLEWDVVAVPGLVEGTFPTGPAGRAPGPAHGWLGELGALPYPLRGDAGGLPHWPVEAARSQRELAESLETFREQCGLHLCDEERRLAYVAVTRARRLLLLSGALWGDGTQPREPSRFLVEVAELADPAPGPPDQGQDGEGQGAEKPDGERNGVRRHSWAEPPPDAATNPREALGVQAAWPVDPLGGHRERIEAGAARVRAALAGILEPPAPARPGAAGAGAGEPGGSGDPVADAWARELALLLAERDAGSRPAAEVELPGHLSASRVVALAEDPEGLALRLRRPMPQPPDPRARRGSEFHAWLEQRFAAAALVDLDELPGAADEDRDGELPDLALLRANFLAGEWAARTPEAVEVSVETPVAGVVLRGRIDAVFGPYPGCRPGLRWEVVDWKTGAPPVAPRATAVRAVQLAVYRLAWARLQGVPVEQVGAAFFYAATGHTVRPVDLLDEAGLVALIGAAVAPRGEPSAPVTAPGPR